LLNAAFAMTIMDLHVISRVLLATLVIVLQEMYRCGQYAISLQLT